MWNMGLPAHYERCYSQHQPRSSNAPPPPLDVSGHGLSAKRSIFYVADQYDTECPRFDYRKAEATVDPFLFTSLEKKNSSSQTPQLDLLPARNKILQPKVASKSAHSAFQPNKMRIRWTPELHDRFLDSVGLLGGAESKRIQLIKFDC